MFGTWFKLGSNFQVQAISTLVYMIRPISRRRPTHACSCVASLGRKKKENNHVARRKSHKRPRDMIDAAMPFLSPSSFDISTGNHQISNIDHPHIRSVLPTRLIVCSLAPNSLSPCGRRPRGPTHHASSTTHHQSPSPIPADCYDSWRSGPREQNACLKTVRV